MAAPLAGELCFRRSRCGAGSSIGVHKEAKSSAKISCALRSHRRGPARAPHRDCTDAGSHDLALGPMPMAHQSPAAIIDRLVGWVLSQASESLVERSKQSSKPPVQGAREHKDY